MPLLSLPLPANDTGSRRFNLAMAATLIPLLAVDIILTHLLHLDTAETLRILIGVTLGSIGFWILLAAYWYCRWRGMTKLKDVCQLAVWAQAAVPAISFLIPLVGRSPYPLVDSTLARIDAGFHFHTVSIVRFMSHFPALKHGLAVTYFLLPALILAALLLPSFIGRALDSQRYVLAVVFAAIVTAALFALWPAAGPWTVEGFSPTRSQAEVVNSLTLLKAGMPLPADAKAGVVAFPSFHVILAVLSVIALWNLRWLRWPAFVFGTAICISTLTTGWHYAIDVIGGLAVTYLVCILAGLVLRPVPAPIGAPVAGADVEVASAGAAG